MFLFYFFCLLKVFFSPIYVSIKFFRIQKKLENLPESDPQKWRQYLQWRWESAVSSDRPAPQIDIPHGACEPEYSTARTPNGAPATRCPCPFRSTSSCSTCQRSASDSDAPDCPDGFRDRRFVAVDGLERPSTENFFQGLQIIFFQKNQKWKIITVFFPKKIFFYLKIFLNQFLPSSNHLWYCLDPYQIVPDSWRNSDIFADKESVEWPNDGCVRRFHPWTVYQL